VELHNVELSMIYLCNFGDKKKVNKEGSEKCTFFFIRKFQKAKTQVIKFGCFSNYVRKYKRRDDGIL
jgi:hypothetical protein